jgi:hypothetical protein
MDVIKKPQKYEYVVYEEARKLYEEGRTLKSISDALGVPSPTIQNWVRDFPKRHSESHILSNIDSTNRKAECSICGPTNIVEPSHWRCSSTRKRIRKLRVRKVKPMKCNRCPFIAKSRSQIDCHHKDGNHSNNDPDNLEWICANCHRLEHFPCL